VVLHFDLDSFFVQVHEQLDPTLRGRALALRQHDDVIACNARAKRLGVARHMAPREAAARLAKGDGKLVQVPEEGDPPRVSYRIYREVWRVFPRFDWNFHKCDSCPCHATEEEVGRT
jgi:hypothetical protein